MIVTINTVELDLSRIGARGDTYVYTARESTTDVPHVGRATGEQIIKASQWVEGPRIPKPSEELLLLGELYRLHGINDLVGRSISTVTPPDPKGLNDTPFPVGDRIGEWKLNDITWAIYTRPKNNDWAITRDGAHSDNSGGVKITNIADSLSDAYLWVRRDMFEKLNIFTPI